jgi:glycosyltransferase involved in cell wall biosynthesis
MPSASVVVCTRNRWALLEMCLSSLDEQAGELEIIVVDNGSHDATPARLQRWAASGPHRMVVSEPLAGLSRARNRGLEAARGEIVLFLDDDALAPVSWAASHLRAYRDETVAAAGGPIVLTFPDGRPRWAGTALEHWWSALSLGDEPGPFPPPHGPYGANMSVRRSSALQAGGFDVALGRAGTSLISSEEADLFQRLWSAGNTIWYVPEAIIVHQVSPDRLRRRWLLRRGLAQGRTNARRDGVLRGAALRRRWRAEIAAALRPPFKPWGALLAGGSEPGAVLNDICRRAGHLTCAWEHLRQRFRAGHVRRSAPATSVATR